MTKEENRASQREVVMLVGIPMFIWYLYKTFNERDTNYYEILKVGYTFSSSDIKKQFYRMSKELHPDKGGSEELFVELQKAYEVLKDEKLQNIYDRIGPDFMTCQHCRTVEDYWSEIVLPNQIAFIIGAFVVLMVFGGSKMPRAPFLVLMAFIIGVQTFIVFGDASFFYNFQMLPFEVFDGLYVLWGTLMSAQVMFSGVWDSDTRTEREILLQVEQSSLQILHQLHNLACLHDSNLKDPQIRKKLIAIINKRDKCFKPLFDNPETPLEAFMKPNSFEFNLKQLDGGDFKLLTTEEAVEEEDDEEEKSEQQKKDD